MASLGVTVPTMKRGGAVTRARFTHPTIGARHGRLTVIGLGEKTDAHGRTYWRFRCDCGTEKDCIASKVLSGEWMSCGCLKRERQKASVTKYADPLQKFRNCLFAGYKRHAQDRHLDFNLEPDEFFALISRPCRYCGRSNVSASSKRYGGKLAYNGVDRVDSTRGYIPDNVVPCCKMCNVMKQRLTVDEFIEHARRIVEYFDARRKA